MDIRRRFLSKKSSGGSSGGDSSGTYTVNLNGQWEKTTAVSNPDSTLYDGVYRSSSNYNVGNGVATMYITLTGYSTFKLYIRSYGESNYDYVMVSQLDKTITGSSSYSDTTLVKAHTRGNQQSGTALSSYTLVEYTGISSGSHTITIVYRKDGSVNSGDDRGYVLIPKLQESGGESGGGDVDIDTTYSIMYTSRDGKVVTPYDTTAFGANIISNTYVNGQGIIIFDGPVTSIGREAFDDRDSLTSITIPNSVTSIGSEAFRDCISLKSITIPNGVTSVGYMAFYQCSSLTSVTIPNSVTSIGHQVFQGCRSLTSVTIGKRVTSIETSTFSGCSSLTSVTIPNSVTKIGQDAFSSCRNLTSVTIPNSVTSIGYRAFSYCTSLTSITIPNSVTSIGDNAFISCDSLKTFYGKYVSSDNRCLIVNGVLKSFAPGGLTEYIIPNSVTSIGSEAFDGCDSLTSITIPDSVTSIGYQAFSYCTSLTSITIPNSVTKIGQDAFSSCRNLTSVTIGNSVTSIKSYAFSWCTSLKAVYCKATTPPTGASGIFSDNASNRKIYVPTASVDAYKSASGWSNYADSIVGYDF